MTLLQRIRRMPPREIGFRLRTAVRTQAQRAAVAAVSPRWDRQALRRVLNRQRLGGTAAALMTQGNWDALEQELRMVMRRRPSLYVLRPDQAGPTSRAVAERWPHVPDEAARDAERILAGRYDLLGYPDLALSPNPSAIRWQRDPVHGRTAPRRFWADVPFLDPACGDHKIIWELNRHQHFLRLGRALWLTGDCRFGERIIDEVHSWLDDNPPLMGINWASMLELGFRSLSWVAAIHFLLGTDGTAPGTPVRSPARWLLDMCLGLDRQLSHLEANLSYYFSPNTHLTGEALALYVAGTALPELTGSSRWAARGRAVLLEEADRQIARDGGHVERSTHYHRYTLDFYLLALQTAERAADTEAAARFRETVDRLATFMRAMTDDDGRMPLIGDDDGGQLWPITGRDPDDVRDSLWLAALLLNRSDLTAWDLPEEVCWLAPAHVRAAVAARPNAPAPSPVTTQVFRETGFVAVRTGSGDHLVFDVGPHGFRNGGHAHADALAITLTLGGRRLLVDPGTATYTMDGVLRDRMRSSLLHNTVTFNRRSSAEPGGPFRWTTAANGRLGSCRGNARLMAVQASHDGYAPLFHHRTLVHGCGGWLVVDEAPSSQVQHAEARWHFDPAWTVHAAGLGVRAVAPDGASAFLSVSDGQIGLIHGAADRTGGWVSPRYGRLVPATTVAVQAMLAPGGALFTWIGRNEAPRLVRQLTLGDSAHGVSVELGSARIVTVLPRADQPRQPRLVASDGYQTDARVLQYSHDASRATAAIVDGTHAETADSRLLTLLCDGPVPDLFAAFDGVTFELCASRPPSKLRVCGAGIDRLQRIVLNGVEVQASQVPGRGGVTVPASDWPATGSGASEGCAGAGEPWCAAAGASAQPVTL